MSSLPKWLNDTLENVLSSKFKECTVTETENISPHLRRIRFAADLSGVYFSPTYAIGIRINERDFRNYSPYSFDAEKGCFDVLFHLHDTSAAGCDFISSLSVGDAVKILIPRGKRFFDPEARIHFSIGDETSLGSSLSVKEAAEKLNSSFLCLHELDEPEPLEKLGLYGYHIPKNNIVDIIEELTDFLIEEKQAVSNDEVIFYLTGNGETMGVIRKFLKGKGVAAKCIKSQAYWIEGKRGL